MAGGHGVSLALSRLHCRARKPSSRPDPGHLHARRPASGPQPQDGADWSISRPSRGVFPLPSPPGVERPDRERERLKNDPDPSIHHQGGVELQSGTESPNPAATRSRSRVPTSRPPTPGANRRRVEISRERAAGAGVALLPLLLLALVPVAEETVAASSGISGSFLSALNSVRRARRRVVRGAAAGAARRRAKGGRRHGSAGPGEAWIRGRLWGEREDERGRGAPGWRARPVCAPRPAWVTKPARPLLGDVGVGWGVRRAGRSRRHHRRGRRLRRCFFSREGGRMYGAAGAPARSASAPVVRSARRPPPQATGSVEKGSPPPSSRSSPGAPAGRGPPRQGGTGKGVDAGRHVPGGGGSGGSGRSVLRPAPRFCSLEKGCKLQAPLWTAGWCGRGEF